MKLKFSHVVLPRLSQIILAFVCCLRELANAFTDIGQFHHNVNFIHKILAFPTKQATSILFNRSIQSIAVAKAAVVVWIFAHLLAVLLIGAGVIYLLINIRADKQSYVQKKWLCLSGLAFILAWYIFALGFGAMDYFLSWMQNIGLNGDLTGYGLPLAAALIYLAYEI